MNQPAPISQNKKMSWKVSMILLILLNVIFIVVILVLISGMGNRGNEIKELRSKQIANPQSATTLAQEELTRYKDQYEKIFEAFPDEDKVIEFVTEIDELRRAGNVTSFSFASDVPLKDSLGIAGLPILIEMKGTEEQVNQAITTLQNMEFIVRPIKTEIIRNEEGVYTVRYGGFLYVDQNFGKAE